MSLTYGLAGLLALGLLIYLWGLKFSGSRLFRD